jgi:hypothetical protein
MGRTTLRACRRVRRLLGAAVTTASIALASRGASADGDSHRLSDALDVEPGATCVTAAALGEHVRAWLGSDQVDADLWVRVKGSDDDPRVVSFTMGRGDHMLARRRFQPGPDRCDDLQAALGLAIALAIRVSLLDDFAPAALRAAPARRDVWALAGDALASWDVLPGAAYGVGVRVERTLPPNFEMRLGFEGQGAWDKTFDHVSGTFDATVLSLRLDACVTFALGGPVGARGCFGFEAGGLYAQGKNFTTPQSSVARWLAVANAFGVTIEVAPRWSLQWTLTLALPLEHPRIGVQTPSGAVVDARDLAALGGELAFGPVYRF